MVGPIGRDLDLHLLAGERTIDERDPAILGPSQRIAAGNHPRRRELHPTSQAQTLRDSRILTLGAVRRAPNGAVIR